MKIIQILNDQLLKRSEDTIKKDFIFYIRTAKEDFNNLSEADQILAKELYPRAIEFLTNN